MVETVVAMRAVLAWSTCVLRLRERKKTACVTAKMDAQKGGWMAVSVSWVDQTAGWPGG